MEDYSYLLSIALILISTKVLGLFSKKIKLPQVVGALLAGVILGPACLGLIHSTEMLSCLSEVGVIVLMFAAGFETDIKELKKSFSDIVEVNGREWSSSSSMFFPEVLDKKRSEVQFLLEEDDLPFTLSKRYRMRASTFILDILLTNVSSSPLKGTYSVVVYLSMPDVCILGSDQRMDMVTKGEVRAKTVKYSSRMEDETQMIFSSTSLFTLTEEIQRSTETTALGEEEFGLGKKIVFHFPLEFDGDESVTYRLVMRVQGPKKDQ